MVACYRGILENATAELHIDVTPYNSGGRNMDLPI